MPYISIVTPTFNEEDNIENLCTSVENIFNELKINYEHIIIDNHSKDKTVLIVKKIIKKNNKVKLIVNNKNYGHLASPVVFLIPCTGDATILLNADFQDPPELIPQLIKSWQNGNKITLLQKITTEENFILKKTRNFYYWFLSKISQTNLTKNTTGSGIIDKSIVNIIKNINDPLPYLRGLLSEVGLEITLLEFNQPKRKKGIPKIIFSLFDLALLGVIKQSKLPLRFMTICGLTISIVFLIAFIFLVLKLVFWNEFDIGKAPVLIGLLHSVGSNFISWSIR